MEYQKRQRVLYILNNAPNYRDKFLQELGDQVDLTVAAYPGAIANLKDPDKRLGYKFIELKPVKFLKINFNLKEYTLANGGYDIIIVGFVLWHPFRLLNIFRKKKRVIAAGLIYGKHDNKLADFLRKYLLNKCETVLVYSDRVKNRLLKEIKTPIISFNNTSFLKSDITPLHHPPLESILNILWVGRYLPRKRVERLYELANRSNRVNIRVIGPGNREVFKDLESLNNFRIYDAAYGSELKEHFEWCHIVFNPGGVGLLAMNAARYGRAIVIDDKSHHGPEIQLAIDANQDIIDFSDKETVDKVIDLIFENPNYLNEKGKSLTERMENKYTVEYMVQQYLKAIEGIATHNGR